MSFLRTKVPTRLLAIIIIVPLALVAFAAWELLLPHRYQSPGPLTLAQAQSHSPIPLPASARNIHIANFRHFQQFVEYVRFEAPVADCEAHAKSLLPGAVPQKIDASTATSFSAPFNPAPFNDVSPFDPRSISHGEQFGELGPSQVRILVDIDRGLFYYAHTD